MTVCPKCKFYSICGGRLNETVENCVRFKSVEQTNDEWRRTCSAEEFANWIREDVCADSFWQRAYDWESWLKEIHK